MTPFAIGLLCAAYIVGLLLTGFSAEVAGLPIGAIASLILGIITAGIVPRLWRAAPRSRWWLAAGLVACLAVFYFQFRTPQPIASDISHWVNKIPQVQVRGEIDSTPRLTRSQKIQFWLKANQVKTSDRTEFVTGKLYVTVPLLQGTGLYPGQSVTASGFLYDPKPAANPGGFNFQAYLKQEGGFAGLSGRSIAPQPGTPPLMWSVRQRML
ncbi:MAG: DUF4131 domain-containing protein, partial [Microcoleus sp. SIO2G3]|nr:DUF4131 domain-containing protein [Microcoleus sp. SIO2G3]